jgi:hypothetical protein
LLVKFFFFEGLPALNYTGTKISSIFLINEFTDHFIPFWPDHFFGQLTAFKPFRPIDHSVRLQTAEGRVDVVSVEPLGWRWCLAKLKKKKRDNIHAKKVSVQLQFRRPMKV